ncbi:MAG: hypothetical protein K9K30_08230 [Burkholderiaceae bacterium]|nr:hypothetical protein [Sulfuritalea sp.]MCF8175211.1 hypothetical protein [Burkholderiaceae bacterium]
MSDESLWHQAILMGAFLLLPLVIVIWGLGYLKTTSAGHSPGSSGNAEGADLHDIAPEDLATAAEQVVLHRRLTELPQMMPLPDGALIDLASGAMVASCACDMYPVAHLEVAWNKGMRLGLVSRRALQRYRVYQEAVAAGLTSLPVVVRADPTDPAPAEDHFGMVTVELRGPKS